MASKSRSIVARHLVSFWWQYGVEAQAVTGSIQYSSLSYQVLRPVRVGCQWYVHGSSRHPAQSLTFTITTAAVNHHHHQHRRRIVLETTPTYTCLKLWIAVHTTRMATALSRDISSRSDHPLLTHLTFKIPRPRNFTSNRYLPL